MINLGEDTLPFPSADAFSSVPSINGGDAGPSNAETGDLFSTTNPVFSSPFIVGGSGGGVTMVAVILSITLVGVVIWILKK